ncbi:MAG: hypothetical protein ACYS8K_06540, partial [Planctomycetota bacterium]
GEALRRGEDQIEPLPFDGVKWAISIWEREGGSATPRLTACNERFAQLAGRNADDGLEGLRRDELLLDHGAEELREERRQRAAKGLAYSGVSSWERPDGSGAYIEWSAIELEGGGRRHVFEVGQEIEDVSATTASWRWPAGAARS